ncbi:hypothetical protein AB4Z01_33750 [Inquilinus sp. YAF38]|uniref:hypothetical protein n=1 Tax=Inquilinus sp. YAF38 TaxID=3233084 RepID=UPI003F912DE9
MGPHLRKLLSIASEPLADTVGPAEARLNFPSIESDLASALASKNGFFAFESALCVFPTQPSDAAYDLPAWNHPALWKKEYDLFPQNCLCFAEDAFGMQFCLMDGMIAGFDPETGEFKRLCRTIEDWAELILDDFDYLTGHSLAHDWQKKHGPLPAKHRLVPLMPFVCGGAFSIDNLAALESTRGMTARADLARQIRDLPDGSKIRFEIIP